MEFRLLGPLEVRRDGRTVELPGGKPRALLAFLLLHADAPVSAERLATALWGEEAPAGAARTVQVYVSRLRRALGDHELLATSRAGYQLRVRPGELDLERFERLVEDGRRALARARSEQAGGLLRKALGLWRGPPLADLAFEPFAEAEIARLEEQRLGAVEARIEADLAAGRHAELMPELQRLVAEHPLRERLHGQLMLALYRAGRQADALHAYMRAREVLVDRLGIEPGRELRGLHRSVLAQDERLDGGHPVAPVGATRGLPAAPNALFGRQGDVDRLVRLVRQPDTRLVTLVGPGGVGKTRLVIEAAWGLADEFQDGARLLELAALSDPDELGTAMARMLGAPVRADEPPGGALARFLADRDLLLVLDNFEQLAAGAPLLAGLLSACPGVNMLITSRQATRLSAERLYQVRPLEVPRRSDSRAALARSSAVELFVDRARARDPDFVLDGATAPHVVSICRRLDGLPLALELAAARLSLLSAAELDGRLDRALSLLVGAAPDAPLRQRTLRATIDWSYGLLDEEERRAFAHSAVFAAGTTLAAAEAVTGASLQVLESLVDKQLLVRRRDRLNMLETIREYALERLADDPVATQVQRRLLDWCLGFAREAMPHLRAADRVAWLARVDLELPNLLAALSWALEARFTDEALELVGHLGDYWWQTGRSHEGLRWADAVVAQSSDASARARARGLLARARLTHRRDLGAYRHDLEAALELFQACGDAAGVAMSLAHLCYVDSWAGQSDAAAARSREALDWAERSGDRLALATAHVESVAAAAGYDETAARAGAAAPYLRQIGDFSGLTFTCSVTGFRALGAGHFGEALNWLDDGFEAARSIDDPQAVRHVSANRGLAKLWLGDLDGATSALADALALTREAGAEHMVELPLLGMAAVAARRGAASRAARLAGAASAHAMPRRAEEEWLRTRLHDEFIASARQRLGERAWLHAGREGTLLTLSEAIDLALGQGRFATRDSDPVLSSR